MCINRKRLIVLFFVNVLIIAHLILWYKFGYQKVGTFSLNGVVSLFGMGLLNSAAVFFMLVVLLTAIFGRLFCGWGCHFAFFQEGALKIFATFGISPKIIHSNANIIQYVFLLKTLTAICEFWLIYGLPQFHVGFGDTPVMTIDLPRSPVVIISFVVFDAFLFIYLMGSRAFCRYVCPWAPMLAVFDNFSLWRVRKVSECKGCMSCTRSCTMGIRTHEEIARYGSVVNPNCIRCLACTNACPNGTLSCRWGLNALSITRRFNWLLPQQWDYKRYHELALIFCGLIAAYYTQKWLGSFQTFLGAAWGLCFGVLIMKFFESRSVPLFEPFQRKRRFLAVSLIVLSTLGWCWSTSTPYDVRLLLRGNSCMGAMKFDNAISIYNQAINEFPSNNEIRSALALAYKLKGDYNRAITEYKILVGGNPEHAALHNNLGTVYYRNGNYCLAIEEYKKAIDLDRDLLAAYGNIGLVFLKQGNVEKAIPFLKKVFPNEEEMLEYISNLYSPDQEKNRNGG